MRATLLRSASTTRAWLVSLSLLLLFVGCGGHRDAEPSGTQPAVVHPLPVHVKNVFDVAWLTDGWLVLNGGPGNFESLWRAAPNGSKVTRLSLPSDPRCRAISYLVPRPLPNGNLGYVRWCYLRHSNRIRISLLEYDISTALEEPMVGQVLDFSPTDFTWNPTMTRGLYSVTSGLCSGIGTMTPAGIARQTITIDVAGRSRPLDETLRLPGSADCADVLRADLPAWAADGSRIAFLASPKSLGVGGFARIHMAWNLYLTDSGGNQPRAVLSNLVEPQGLAWSPDSRALAYSGAVEGGGRGVWLYDLATRHLRKLARGRFTALAFSPNGSEIAVVHQMKNSGQALPATELVVLTMASPSMSDP
jgi:WD40-like Beta Propeller Repeat